MYDVVRGMAIAAMLIMAVFFVCAITANPKRGEPFWPTSGHKGALYLGLAALVCAHMAGFLVAS